MSATTPGSPADTILDHLLRSGEATVRELEAVLGVSTTAVREHLTHLQARDLVSSRLARHGPGRPHLVYSLTPKAQSLSPRAYDTLIVLLLREIAQRDGTARLEAILDAVGVGLAEEYRADVGGAELTERLQQLCAVLEQRGVPAEVLYSAACQELQLFACPYRDVIHEHPAVCAMERRMFESLLGEQLEITSTIRDGQRSCCFRVIPRHEG